MRIAGTRRPRSRSTAVDKNAKFRDNSLLSVETRTEWSASSSNQAHSFGQRKESFIGPFGLHPISCLHSSRAQSRRGFAISILSCPTDA